MNILFLRHALAVDRQNGVDHPERQLTVVGVRQSRIIGAFARRNDLKIDKVFSSPYRRARETASHFVSELPKAPAIQVVKWLEIDTPNEVLIDEIYAVARSNCNSVLVGHEPDFSLALSSLLHMRQSGIKVRKASLTCLSCVDTGANEFQLRWSITPDLLLESDI